MIPSKAWFPTTLPLRADWYNNFAVQFATVAVLLGFELSDIAWVEADNDMMQFLVDANDQMNAVIAASRAYRNTITESDIGTPDPNWPTQFAGSPPLPQVPAGLFERLDNLVKRIRLSAAYTEEIGELLGIIPKPTTETDFSAIPPNPSLRVEPGNVLYVDFVKGKSNGIEIQMRLDNEETWASVGRFSSSPATINVPASPGNLPRFVEIRARWSIKDVSVGPYSETDTISTVP